MKFEVYKAGQLEKTLDIEEFENDVVNSFIEGLEYYNLNRIYDVEQSGNVIKFTTKGFYIKVEGYIYEATDIIFCGSYLYFVGDKGMVSFWINGIKKIAIEPMDEEGVKND